MSFKQKGFTLIEVMIAVVIAGIIAAIAYPNYQGYVRRTACEDAKGVLTGAAGVMERFRAQNNTFVNAPLGAYSKSPVEGAEQFSIQITASDATSYTLTATPSGLLAGEGTLTLNSAGVRGGTGDLANTWTSCRGI